MIHANPNVILVLMKENLTLMIDSVTNWILLNSGSATNRRRYADVWEAHCDIEEASNKTYETSPDRDTRTSGSAST